MTVVIDASALVDLALGTERGARVQERLTGAPEELHAPHLIDLEVLQALRRLVQAREITRSRADEILGRFATLRLVRYPHQPLLARIWSLRDNLSAYDAAYIALAESLAAVLLTCDGGLAATPGHRARVELV